MPKSTNSGSNSHAYKARRKQIEKLRQQKLNVTILHTDVQYKVDFPVKSESTITVYSIVINLPPSFPNDPPVLLVQPPCSHKYLDPAQLVVNLPALDNFKRKPDLSSVVKHIISEFEKNPPIPLVLNAFEQQQQEEILRSYTSPYLPVVKPEALPTPPTVHVACDTDQPPGTSKLQAVLPELEELSIEELRELDTDEMQLLALIQGTELAQNISQKREEISKRVESIANENLSLSKNLVSLRDQLVSKHKTCEKLKAEYENNIMKFSEVTEWMTLPNLSLTLQVSAAEQEQVADKLVEDFLEGSMEVTTFTKKFLKSKSLATTRKVKEDKILHISGIR